MSSSISRVVPTSRMLQRIYRLLYGAYGPMNWWPADSPFEVIVGAFLTQNTAWKNVEKAISNLKKADLMDPEKIDKISEKKLASLIKPSGYYNQKAKKIKSFVKHFGEKYDYSIEKMKQKPLPELRKELLEMWGVGPETADSILLYALEKPIFVVDAYTMRTFRRLGFLTEEDDYESTQKMFMKHLKPDTTLYNEYHALIVALGNRLCRAKQPLCKECPLHGHVECVPSR